MYIQEMYTVHFCILLLDFYKMVILSLSEDFMGRKIIKEVNTVLFKKILFLIYVSIYRKFFKIKGKNPFYQYAPASVLCNSGLVQRYTTYFLSIFCTSCLSCAHLGVPNSFVGILTDTEQY